MGGIREGGQWGDGGGFGWASEGSWSGYGVKERGKLVTCGGGTWREMDWGRKVGAVVLRRRRQPMVAATAAMATSSWSGKGVAAVATARMRAAAAAYGGGDVGNGDILVVGERSGGGGDGTYACGGGDGDWTPSPTFCEQPLEREETPFFSQMMARVCRGVPSPPIEPKMGLKGKGPT